MVAFKYLLLSAAAVFGVLAQDEGSDADAAAAWAQMTAAGDDLSVGNTNLKRFASEARTTTGGDMGDPYWGDYCRAPFTKPPCATTCNRNNCFRGFLNIRDGSDGKHCPINAFNFCCGWNWLPHFAKIYVVKKNLLYAAAPYAANCNSPGDTYAQIVAKVDDVCGCTLNHEVLVDKSSDYYKAKCYGPGDSHCHK